MLLTLEKLRCLDGRDRRQETFDYRRARRFKIRVPGHLARVCVEARTLEQLPVIVARTVPDGEA